MTDAPWLVEAKQLQCGRSRRIVCCGADASMLVRHTPKGYGATCFRCGQHPWQPHGDRSITEILRHRAEAALDHSSATRLPLDYTLDVPIAYAWYIKYGISPEKARKLGIGWSSRYQRVVIPIYGRDGSLMGVQMRAVHADQKPKYVNPGGAAIRSVLYWTHPPSEIVVVTEDVLSAIKVSKAAPAVSTLGTTMTDERATRIAAEARTAVVWYDNDKAGRKGEREAVHQLKMQGMIVYRVRSERDPKTYNTDEIREHLRRMELC